MPDFDPLAQTVLNPPGGESLSASLVPASEPQLSDLLAGRYELVALLGMGGMGAVYRALDRELGEPVALKMLRSELANVEEMLARFRQEVKLARKVTSPNVARTFDIGEHEGLRFLTMELVEGESLADLLERDAPLTPDRALALAAQVATGLAAAHAANVIHRDLKPENVLLGRDGSVKVTDFGIATALGGDGTQRVVGTPAYMAPEQVTAERDLDARADVYAFGVMLYEMLTGRRPWTGENAMATAAARLLRPPPDPRAIRPDLPAPVAELVLRLMAREREERPQHAAEALAALAELAPTSAREHSLRPAALTARESFRSVAILPLANDGPPEDEYVAAAITDELIDGLSGSPSIRVQSHGAVARFAGKGADPRAIGRELGVHVVVSGALRRFGERVRLTVRILSVADGFQIRALRFERPFGEVLSVSDEAVAAVKSALSVEATSPRRAPLADARALDLYLRARHAYHAYGKENLALAMSLLDEALSRSPDDPMILAAKAACQVRHLTFGVPRPGDFAEAVAAAERAVELAPELCEAQFALATIRLNDLRYEDAARHARRALEVAPSNGEARAFVGRMLAESGRSAKGLEHLRVALTIAPEMAVPRVDVMRVLALDGDWAAAGAAAAAYIEGDPPWSFWYTAMRIFSLWRRVPLDEDLAKGLARSKYADDPTVLEQIALRERNDLALAERVRSVLVAPTATPSTRAFGAQLRTEVFAYARRTDEAVAALEQAVDLGLADRLWIERCPLVNELREAAPERVDAARARVAPRAAEIARVLL